MRGGKTAWRAQKILKVDDGDGKPRRVFINATRKSPQEAVFAVLERLLALDDSSSQNCKKIKNRNAETIDELLDNHLREISAGDGCIRELTATNYGYAIKSILRPEYGLAGLAVSEISPEVIRGWRSKLNTVPTKRTGKPLGSLYIKKMVMFLNDALNAAVATGKIQVNPMGVKTPADKRRAKLSREQEEQRKTERAEAEQINDRLTWFPQTLFHHLLKAFRQQPNDWAHSRLTYVALSLLGIRPSEVRGLSLDKVKFTPGKESIKVSQVMVGTKIVNATKTRSSTRTIPLVEPWLGILREQVRRRKLATDDKSAMLLVSRNGKGAFRQQTQNDDYRELLDELGLERIRLYANRHLCVSALQKLGADMTTISEIVGWEKPSDDTMLAVYGHFHDEMKIRDTVVKLGCFITAEPKREF